LWFIYVLSIYLLLVPALFYQFGRRPILLLIASVILACFEWPGTFGLHACVEYLPFFVLGIILWLHRPLWSPVRGWLFWPSTIIFIALLRVFHAGDGSALGSRRGVGFAVIGPVPTRTPKAFRRFWGTSGKGACVSTCLTFW